MQFRPQALAIATIACLLVMGAPGPAMAQMTQALRGAATPNEEAVKRAIEEIVATVSHEKAFMEHQLHDSNPTLSPAATKALLKAIVEADLLLAAEDDIGRFQRRFVHYTIARDALTSYTTIRISSVSPSYVAATNELLSNPQIGLLVKEVVFTLGGEISMGDDVPPVQALQLDTNLLGAAAGNLIGGLGSKDLKEFLTNNIGGTVSFPTANSNKLGGQISVGLGGISFRNFTIWPTLGMEQLSGEDDRIPESIREGLTEENSSAPEISIGIIAMTIAEFQKKLKAGGLVPVFSLSVRLPFYYPGDSYSALGALFTNDRSKFDKAGKVQFQFGVSFPIRKVDPPKADTGS